MRRARRAALAEAALERYAIDGGKEVDQGSLYEVIFDLMVDLRHLATLTGIDLDELTARASLSANDESERDRNARFTPAIFGRIQ